MYARVNNAWQKGKGWVFASGQWRKGKASWVFASGQWRKMAYDAIFNLTFNSRTPVTESFKILNIPYTNIPKAESLIEGFSASLNQPYINAYTEKYEFRFPYDVSSESDKKESQAAANRFKDLFKSGVVTVTFHIEGQSKSVSLKPSVHTNVKVISSLSAYVTEIQAAAISSDPTIYDYLKISNTTNKLVTVTLKDSTPQ